MRARSAVKQAIHRVGLAALAHRLRNRRTLTVAAFHRVLATGDPRWAEADPEWTMSRTLFAACLDFLARHYNVIGMPELLRARAEGARLPDRSLLISFDDGWADTVEHALPELLLRALPAVVFVASSAVGRTEPFWREQLAANWRTGRLGPATCRKLWSAASGGDPPPWNAEGLARLVTRLAELDPQQRAALLEPRSELRGTLGGRAMLSANELRALDAAGIYVGSHGASHEPLDLVADPREELQGSRLALAELLGRTGAAGPAAFSFPHGRYLAEHIGAGLGAGYELLFTSEPCLMRLDQAEFPQLVGRISIDGRQIAGTDGRLRPELFAFWLFWRPMGPPVRP